MDPCICHVSVLFRLKGRAEMHTSAGSILSQKSSGPNGIPKTFHSPLFHHTRVAAVRNNTTVTFSALPQPCEGLFHSARIHRTALIAMPLSTIKQDLGRRTVLYPSSAYTQLATNSLDSLRQQKQWSLDSLTVPLSGRETAPIVENPDDQLGDSFAMTAHGITSMEIHDVDTSSIAPRGLHLVTRPPHFVKAYMHIDDRVRDLSMQRFQMLLARGELAGGRADAEHILRHGPDATSGGSDSLTMYTGMEETANTQQTGSEGPDQGVEVFANVTIHKTINSTQDPTSDRYFVRLSNLQIGKIRCQRIVKQGGLETQMGTLTPTVSGDIYAGLALADHTGII